jgi:inner membrane protein involved in colicin E2 resistance
MLFGTFFLVLTALATLGFALHYLVDLIAAVPFAVAVHAFFTPRSADIERERRQALITGGLAFLAWVLLLRFGTSLLLSSTVLAWALAAVVCIPALVLEGRLYRRLSA